jgi:Kdo2-lipid IVA lauroyltransferase/acyltransferase
VDGALGGLRRRRLHRHRPIRYFLEYVGLRLVGGLMRLLPLEIATEAMAWSWRTVAPRLSRHPRVLAHLALAYPELSEMERDRIARDMWSSLGRTFAESFVVDKIVRGDRIDDRVAPLLAEIKTGHRGIVFVSLHTGNWELAIIPAVTAGIKAAGIYQKVKNPWVDHYLTQTRRERYPRGLFAKGSDIALKLMRIARDGGAVALLADLRDRRGVSVSFFEHAAPSTTFPALLCRSTGATLVASRVVRTGVARFRMEAVTIEVPRTDNRDADVLEATRRIHALFEDWVREHPEQWMWAHRRWG